MILGHQFDSILSFAVTMILFSIPIALVWWEVLDGHFKIKLHHLGLAVLIGSPIAGFVLALVIKESQFSMEFFLWTLGFLAVVMAVVIFLILVVPLVQMSLRKRRVIDEPEEIVISLPSPQHTNGTNEENAKPPRNKKWWAKQTRKMRFSRYGTWL
jgi:hypothetical protein